MKINEYKQIFSYIKPYLRLALVSILLTLPAGALDAVIVMTLKPYMDVIMLNKSIHSPWMISFLILLFTSIQGLLNFSATYINSYVAGQITNEVKIILFENLLNRETSFFDKNTSGFIQKAFNNDVSKAFGSLLGYLKSYALRIFSAISLIIVLIYNCWQLAIIAVLILVFALIPVTQVKNLIKNIVNDYENENAKVIADYNETFSGNKIISAFNLKNFQINKLKKHLKKAFQLDMKIILRTGWTTPLMRLVAAIGIGLIIGIGSTLINNNTITSGNFVAFVTALILLFNPIKGIGNDSKNLQTSILAIERVINELEYIPKIKNNVSPIFMKHFNSGIEFKNVSFEYRKNKKVLHELSFKINKGEKIALVGHSGGGKSTIINLIPRFYDVSNGEILIDGINIKNYNINSLRNNISIVLQDNFIFTGTIRENLKIIKPDATDEDLFSVLQSSYLYDFVMSTEKGLDTQVGERGLLLSGGQKQRLGIARAFLKDSPIIIFDEATSALDNESEFYIKKAIENLMKDKTVIIIAHRFSTINDVDKIIVIDEGKIVEQGSQTQLLQNTKGKFKKLYDLQTK
ncbi:phospholipid-lipopolysaccharide ABC transporter [Brachyspira sp. CAG:484]|nr:phospholipid-lipopolysaccharide ABC transporter [Brachyspira sp. CAG:484]